MIIDIRAREMSQLRGKTRALTAALAEIEQNARANDRILLTLHKLALLLIDKPPDWPRQAEALLKKQFSLLHCELIIFGGEEHAALGKTAARLPAGGRAAAEPLAGAPTCKGARRYFYLPIKKGGRAAGLLLAASKKAEDFPDDAARDFSRRLAELLAAAL